jgi:hypothetical protein
VDTGSSNRVLALHDQRMTYAAFRDAESKCVRKAPM